MDNNMHDMAGCFIGKKRRIGIIAYAFLLFCLILIIPGSLNAQDVRFSLYQYNPLHINPANTGNFNGNWRLAANFRNHWINNSEPYRTGSASFDTKASIFHQSFGMGVYFLNDESGIGGLTYNKIYGSIAYGFKFLDNYFDIGIQPGFVFASVNSWYNWDYNTGEFNADNGEINFGETASYFDLNGGLRWKRSIGKTDLEAGLSLFHINKPNISFFGGEDKENILSVVDVSARIGLSEKLYLQPAAMIAFQSGITYSSLGTSIGYDLFGKSTVKNIFAGLYVRNGLVDELNTMSVAAGASVKRVDIALCYDYTLGAFGEAAGAMGAFELAIIYRSISTYLNSYSIPCERY